MIEIQPLPQGKYLLGFSAGVDSSALFFLLMENQVRFDIAIVDYGLREQSKEEVSYAKDLAKRYAKQCFCIQAPLFQNNFEAQAREFRYEFFSQTIKEHQYDGLLLAHQLDDRVEWMMMQFCKGAGLNTLLGFDFVQQREHYLIYRPLLKISKARLYEYCQKQKILYFEDLSNQEEKYTRNMFRKHLSALSEKYSRGIVQSFEYLAEQRDEIYPQKPLEHFAGITFWQRSGAMQDIHILDLELKRRGYVLSAKQKAEIERCSFSCEICDFVIESTSSRIFVCTKEEGKMDKKFKDFARRWRIPKRLRYPLFQSQKNEEDILEFIEKIDLQELGEVGVLKK